MQTNGAKLRTIAKIKDGAWGCVIEDINIVGNEWHSLTENEDTCGRTEHLSIDALYILRGLGVRDESINDSLRPEHYNKPKSESQRFFCLNTGPGAWSSALKLECRSVLTANWICACQVMLGTYCQFFWSITDQVLVLNSELLLPLGRAASWIMISYVVASNGQLMEFESRIQGDRAAECFSLLNIRWTNRQPNNSQTSSSCRELGDNQTRLFGLANLLE